MKTYQVAKTENGWEVWDGTAFENPPLAFSTRKEAKAVADGLSAVYAEVVDETLGSVMTGRELE